MRKIDEWYSRQILYPEIGAVGQEKLGNSTVVLIGCGALGSSHAEMLTRAGVGHLKVVDRDFVETSNLQRQSLFREKDAIERLPKAVAAKKRLSEINSHVTIEALVADVTPGNIDSMIGEATVVIDGTDNFQTRYLLNDAAVKAGIPWIYGAAVSSYGTSMTIVPHETPCLRCIFDEMPEAGSYPTCDTAGVIMPIISMISSIQVTESLKVMTGKLDQLHNSLVQFDVWHNEYRSIRLGEPDPECLCCGKGQYMFLDRPAQANSAVLCGRDAVQISPSGSTTVNLAVLAKKLETLVDTKVNAYLLRFEIADKEITVFTDGRAIIRGTDDIAAARSLYDRYIGG